jgi:hypothetical protein
MQKQKTGSIVCYLYHLLFNGLIRKINAASPAIKGNSIAISPIFGSRPTILRSLGLAESCENRSGFDADLSTIATSRGNAPIVLETIRIIANMRIYRQTLFFPVNDASRCFIVKNFRPFRIQNLYVSDNLWSNEGLHSHDGFSPF